MAKTEIVMNLDLIDLFGMDIIKLNDYYDTFPVRLYKCIEDQLLVDLEQYGLYETFDEAVDSFLERLGEDPSDEELDKFLERAKEWIMKDIKNHDLDIQECFVVGEYNSFKVVIDINFTRMWKKFKGE